MKKGKIIFIETKKVISEKVLENLELKFQKEKIEVEYAAEGTPGFYTLAEATLHLLQRGVKKITAFPMSLGEEFEIPVFWGTN